MGGERVRKMYGELEVFEKWKEKEMAKMGESRNATEVPPVGDLCGGSPSPINIDRRDGRANDRLRQALSIGSGSRRDSVD